LCACSLNPVDPPILYGEQDGTAVEPGVLETLGQCGGLKATAGSDDVTGVNAVTASFVLAFAQH
jgi:hypothetical protein